MTSLGYPGSARSSASGIQKLPNELLAAVFEQGARMGIQDAGLPFTVLASHVCGHWRAVALCTPSVWCSVPVRPAHDAITSMFLERSEGHALDICLTVEQRGCTLQDVNHALKLVKPAIPRCVNLYVCADGAPGAYIVFAFLALCLDMARVRHFELRVGGKQSAIGWLPASFEQSMPPRLASVVMAGMSFRFGSPILRGLTHLTLAYLARDMSNPTFADFRELVIMSPQLEYLKLAGVFPQLSEHLADGELALNALHTLELVMKRDDDYVPLFFSVISAPALQALSFESKWKVTWDGFEAAIPTIAAKFEDLRVLRLTMSNSFEFDDLGVDRQLFGAFPNLRELTLNVLEDAQALHFLRAWIDAIMPLKEEEEAAHADSEPLYQEFWPLLELLTVRAPYDNNEDDDQPSLDDSLDLLGSLRLSLGQPFDVWQESIFNSFTVDPLDVD